MQTLDPVSLRPGPADFDQALIDQWKYRRHPERLTSQAPAVVLGARGQDRVAESSSLMRAFGKEGRSWLD